MVVELLSVAIASAAALADVRSRRIPNWLTAGALVSGVLVNTWQAGGSGVVVSLTGAALGLVLLLPFYLLKGIGAGDVKLLAALGALLGPQALVSVAIYGALVGGAISVVVLSRRGAFAESIGASTLVGARPSLSGAKAAYGVAIAAGVYLSMLLPRVVG